MPKTHLSHTSNEQARWYTLIIPTSWDAEAWITELRGLWVWNLFDHVRERMFHIKNCKDGEDSSELHSFPCLSKSLVSTPSRAKIEIVEWMIPLHQRWQSCNYPFPTESYWGPYVNKYLHTLRRSFQGSYGIQKLDFLVSSSQWRTGQEGHFW